MQPDVEARAYDLVTIGGGLAGAALGYALAAAGANVLILERERRFRDRVRGECLYPWGRVEARKLGIEAALRGGGAVEVPFLVQGLNGIEFYRRDLAETTPHATRILDFHHPEMQEALLASAERAGARVMRPATALGIVPDRPARVEFRHAGRRHSVQTRLVAGCDGRRSRVCRWAGLKRERDPDLLRVGGLMLRGVAAPTDTGQIWMHAGLQRSALLFPLPDGRFRGYAVHRVDDPDPFRSSRGGEDTLGAFVAYATEVGLPAHYFEDARLAGPLAMYDGADSFVPHPASGPVALVGDAAAANDPAWGHGLSLTLRDVRTLRDALLAAADWSRAAHDYAEAHDAYYTRLRRLSDWGSQLVYARGSDADERRVRAFSKLLLEQDRIPDVIGLGPEAPSDAAAERRFFGE